MKINQLLNEHFINKDPKKDSESIKSYLGRIFDDAKKLNPKHFELVEFVLDHYPVTICVIPHEILQKELQRDAIFVLQDYLNWKANTLYITNRQDLYDLPFLLIHETRHIIWTALHKILQQNLCAKPYFPEEEEQHQEFFTQFQRGRNRFAEFEKLLDKEDNHIKLSQQDSSLLKSYKEGANTFNLTKIKLDIPKSYNYDIKKQYQLNKSYDLNFMFGTNFGQVKVQEIKETANSYELYVDPLNKNRAMLAYEKMLMSTVIGYPEQDKPGELDAYRLQFFSPEINDLFFYELNKYQKNLIDNFLTQLRINNINGLLKAVQINDQRYSYMPFILVNKNRSNEKESALDADGNPTVSIEFYEKKPVLFL